VLGRIWNLNPNRNWQSRFASLRHNMWLMFETFFVSCIITFLWTLCYRSKWPFHVHHEPDLIMVNTAILVCAAIFAFIAATLFAQVRARSVLLSRAVLLHDEVEFMLSRDEKVQIMMHVVVAFFGFAVLSLSSVVAYSQLWVGAMIIFLETSSIVVYFTAMFEMQEIKNSTWFVTHTPTQWLMQDAVQFFKEHKNKTSCT
jgi:hypothetical protein